MNQDPRHRRRLSRALQQTRPAVRELARVINAEIDRLFAPNIQILAEPGRFLVATAATSVARIIGKACATANRVTTLTTAFITRSAASSSTIASIT